MSVVLLDQLTKLWAMETLSDGQSTRVLGDFLMFTLVFNEGGAMGTNFGSSTYYLISSFLVLLFVLYYVYTHRNERRIIIPLAFLSGGAIGNIIDRARLGSVIDFIDFDFFDIDIMGFHLQRWWAFNIADAALTCSILFLVVSVLFFDRTRHREVPPNTDTV